MTARQRVMLLIDADNVSADVIEQAVHRTLDVHGAVHVRRAYCNAETALKQQALFKRLSVRPMVNLSAGKNSTDIAMAVDAMDLVIAERPDLVVLVSSDSDFAPLVLRLREKGARVCGIGQRGKTGDETRAAYDEFIDLTHQGPRAPAAPVAVKTDAAVKVLNEAPPPARKAAAKKVAKTARKTAAAKKSPRAATPAVPAMPAEAAAPVRRPAARKATRKTAAQEAAAPAAAAAAAAADADADADASAKSAARAPAPAPAPVAVSSETAERILQAAPALRSGSDVALNDIAKALRAAKLLGKHASSLKLFDKLPAEFAVLQHPDRIRWLGAARP